MGDWGWGTEGGLWVTAGGVWRLGEGCGGLKEGMLAQGGRDATERLIVQPARLKIHYDTGFKKDHGLHCKNFYKQKQANDTVRN